ncbi:MAG TPA: sugar ABC transporter permease, partial [Bacilli bacterium]
MGYNWLDRNLKWVYTAPSVIFVLVMMVFPIAYTFRLSFFQWSMSAVTPPEWVGFGNYIGLFKDPRFWNALYLTIYYTAFALAVETVLGVAIAMLFFRKYRGANIVKTLFLLP